jgi:Fe-S cluster biogenesis protein NfuA
MPWYDPGNQGNTTGGHVMEWMEAGDPGSSEEFARRVAAALEQVRPALQADGGDIELVAVVGADARVRLKGACHG